MRQLAQDDFNRADAATLGSAWTVLAGAWSIVSNQASGTVNKSLAAFDGGVAWPQYQWASVRVANSIASLPGAATGVCVRLQGSGESGYVGTMSAGGCKIFRADSGTYTDISSGGSATVWAVGDVGLLVCEAGENAVFKMYRNGVLDVTSSVDTTYTSGKPGILHAAATFVRYLDDFQAGNLNQPESAELAFNLWKLAHNQR